MVQVSHLYMTTGKTIALTKQPFVGKMMSLLFNMLSRFVIAFSSKDQATELLSVPCEFLCEPLFMLLSELHMFRTLQRPTSNTSSLMKSFQFS